jgi:hypothetical protein
MPNLVDEHSTCIARDVAMSRLRAHRCDSEREFARATDARVIRDARNAVVGEY